MTKLIRFVVVLSVVGCGVETKPNPHFDAGRDSGGTGGSAGTGGTSGSGGSAGDAAVFTDAGLDAGDDGAVDGGVDATTPLPCDGACGGSTPYCDMTSMQCAACLESGHCSGGFCDTGSHTCVACTATEGCGSGTVCDVTNRTCVQCVGPVGCTLPQVCADDGNTCVACNESSDCNSASLVCLTNGHSCVECNTTEDCDNNELCKTSGHTCEQCLADSDCTDPAAARCNPGTNTCVPCSDNTQCTGVTDGATALNVCSAGLCVECDVSNETPCNGNSCIPATRRCSTTPLASIGTCGACRADSECMNAQARCVPMNFNGTPRPGGYCLRQKGNTDCGRPLSVLVNGVSMSGASAVDYCGIDQALTTCEAVLSRNASTSCDDGTGQADVSLCGAPGLSDAVCATVGGNELRCTYACSEAVQCPGTSASACPLDEPYCH